MALSMEKFVQGPTDDLASGCVFRFAGQWPHEACVDLMLVSMPDDFSEFGLVVTTGHKAGLVLVRLPKECESTRSRGVRHDWLVNNWSKWVYPECDVADVWLLRRYAAPDLP